MYKRLCRLKRIKKETPPQILVGPSLFSFFTSFVILIAWSSNDSTKRLGVGSDSNGGRGEDESPQFCPDIRPYKEEPSFNEEVMVLDPYSGANFTSGFYCVYGKCRHSRCEATSLANNA